MSLLLPVAQRADINLTHCPESIIEVIHQYAHLFLYWERQENDADDEKITFVSRFKIKPSIDFKMSFTIRVSTVEQSILTSIGLCDAEEQKQSSRISGDVSTNEIVVTVKSEQEMLTFAVQQMKRKFPLSVYWPCRNCANITVKFEKGVNALNGVDLIMAQDIDLHQLFYQ